MVDKGDFLTETDPRPCQIALKQAECQLAKDQALLKERSAPFDAAFLAQACTHGNIGDQQEALALYPLARQLAQVEVFDREAAAGSSERLAPP